MSADAAGGLGPGGNIANCPIALDSNGVPHVAYASSAAMVEYATWNGISWSTQSVDLGSIYSIVFDNSNTPHLVYAGSEGLMYATWAGSNWTLQTVDPNGASFAALAFDSASNPHIAYDNGTTVKYASWTGSSWQIQIVDNVTAPAVGLQVYLALNQSNIPYIMYGYSSSDNGKEVVQLAIGNYIGWNIQTIPLPSPISGFGNMVLDTKGYPHLISSQNNVNNTSVSDLFYVSWNGTGWTTQKVASNIPLKINAPNLNWMDIGSVALDAKNNPHITYTTTTGKVMYASRTSNSWDIQPVGGNTSATEPGFLALDSSGDPHISFYVSVVSYYGYANLNYIVNVMYATAKEPFPRSVGQIFIIIILGAVIAAVVAVSLLLYTNRISRFRFRRLTRSLT